MQRAVTLIAALLTLSTLDLATILDTAPSDRYSYFLDSLGNRDSGAAQVFDYTHDTDTDGDGIFDATDAYETTIDLRNTLKEVSIDGGAPASLTHDGIGSITADSPLNLSTAMYDAWGRLAYWAYYDPGSTAGAQLGQLYYDALGRLCRRLAPWPTDYNLSRVETYHHDGVRRIQEIFEDPAPAPAPWQQQGGGGGGGSGPQTRMEREYVWAAHETAGVNERVFGGLHD